MKVLNFFSVSASEEVIKAPEQTNLRSDGHLYKYTNYWDLVSRFLNSRYGSDLFLSCVFGEQAILSSRKKIVSWPFDSASLYWFYSIII